MPFAPFFGVYMLCRTQNNCVWSKWKEQFIANLRTSPSVVVVLFCACVCFFFFIYITAGMSWPIFLITQVNTPHTHLLIFHLTEDVHYHDYYCCYMIQKQTKYSISMNKCIKLIRTMIRKSGHQASFKMSSSIPGIMGRASVPKKKD